MKRALDILGGLILLAICAIPLILVALAVRLTSPGPALYWSDRVGRYNKLFKMPKFRTMRIDTPVVASHLLTDRAKWNSPIGDFLRRSSLDEMPQLWNILKGDMSFVGPRPALYNQDDLIALRTEKNVHTLVPGLTGWAQVQGRAELEIPEKVEKDAYYLEHQSIWFDFKILWITFWKVIRREDIIQGDAAKKKEAEAPASTPVVE